MVEAIQRERFSDFHRSVYLGRVLGLLLGATPEGLQRAEESLEFAVFQTAFDPEQMRQRLEEAQRLAAVQREERLRDARLMDRVASYSADDEDGTDLDFSSVEARQARRQQGITNAWGPSSPSKRGEK